jgi:DNA-binding NarL/FixJ family response regulator
MTGGCPAGRAPGAVREAMIDVVIVEDDRIVRDGLAELVDAEPGMRCRRRHGSVEQALAAPAAPAPDVILLDIHLPGMLGSVGVAALCARHPAAAVVMLTIHDDEDRVFESICNGARGYLLKKTPPARLIEHIREAHDGGAPMSPEIARQVIRAFRQFRPAPPQRHGLTPQEVRLLALLADGHSYQSAAAQLSISINTIRNYVRSVYDKLHVHSRSEAVARAIQSGILR